MGLLFCGVGAVKVWAGAALATLDLGGYLLSNEVASLVAGLFSALFAGLANALISGFFAGVS